MTYVTERTNACTTAEHRRPAARQVPQHRGALRRPLRTIAPELIQPGVLSLLLSTWWLSLRDVPLDRMNDLGLVSVLPPMFFVALTGIVVSFVFQLRRASPNRLLLGLHVAALLLMVTGTAAVLEGLPRLEASYRHLGIADHLQRGGRIDADIDAYFNWPGFFALLALAAEAGAVEDLLAVATWAPFLFGLLMLPGLLLIGRALTTDSATLWLGVALFYAANWTGQDYLSPQAFALLLYVYAVGLLLTGFRGPVRTPAQSVLARVPMPAPLRRGWDRPLREDGRHTPASAGPGLTMVAVALTLLLTTTYAHQLTPYAAVISLSALVFVGRCRAALVPVALGVATAAWLLFFASSYLTGHVEMVLGGVGDVSGSAAANVTGRITGSAQHQFVVALRLVIAGLMWLLALVGALALRRAGRSSVAAMVLAFSPFLVLGLQSYGGEAAIRVYLLGLPFVAHLVAAALVAGRRQDSLLRYVIVACVLTSVAMGTLVTRHGNERAESFTAGEFAVVERAYELAPRGSVLVAVAQNTAWRYQEYNEYDYRTLVHAEPGVVVDPPTVADLLTVAQRGQRQAFLLLTNSQLAAADLYGTVSGQAVRDLITEAERRGIATRVYSNEDAALYELRRPTP